MWRLDSAVVALKRRKLEEAVPIAAHYAFFLMLVPFKTFALAVLFGGFVMVCPYSLCLLFN